MPIMPEFDWLSASPDELAHWQEYQTALGEKLLRSIAPDVLCEWQILGRGDRVVYVMAICMGIEPVGELNPGHPTIRIPAVIHLNEGGNVASVDAPGAGTHYARDIRELFPAELHAIIFDGSNYEAQLHEHLRWRLDHPDQPPLIVLESTPDT
jgi:hypothetical protein